MLSKIVNDVLVIPGNGVASQSFLQFLSENQKATGSLLLFDIREGENRPTNGKTNAIPIFGIHLHHSESSTLEKARDFINIRLLQMR